MPSSEPICSKIIWQKYMNTNYKHRLLLEYSSQYSIVLHLLLFCLGALLSYAGLFINWQPSICATNGCGRLIYCVIRNGLQLPEMAFNCQKWLTVAQARLYNCQAWLMPEMAFMQPPEMAFISCQKWLTVTRNCPQLPEMNYILIEIAFNCLKWLIHLPEVADSCQNGVQLPEVAGSCLKWRTVARNRLQLPEIIKSAQKWLIAARNGIQSLEMAYRRQKWLTVAKKKSWKIKSLNL